jgi:hypothetical protein
MSLDPAPVSIKSFLLDLLLLYYFRLDIIFIWNHKYYRPRLDRFLNGLRLYTCKCHYRSCRGCAQFPILFISIIYKCRYNMYSMLRIGPMHL